MALPVPNLDDRRFQDLVDDAKRLVQQRCPEWTDHNVSDPGVTLIELFAWMTDQLVYRLNRVPDRNYVKFLELIGVSLFPPTAARSAGHVLALGAAARRRHDPERDAGRDGPHGDGRGDRVRDRRGPADRPGRARRRSGSMVDGKTLRDHMAALEKGTEVFCFQKVPSPGDALFIGLSEAVPSNAVRLRFQCRHRGRRRRPDEPAARLGGVDGRRLGAVRAGLRHDRRPQPRRRRRDPRPARPRRVADREAARGLAPRPRHRAGEGQPAYSASPNIKGLERDHDRRHRRRRSTPSSSPTRSSGISEGVPGQRFVLKRGPVVPGDEPADPRGHRATRAGTSGRTWPTSPTAARTTGTSRSTCRRARSGSGRRCGWPTAPCAATARCPPRARTSGSASTAPAAAARGNVSPRRDQRAQVVDPVRVARREPAAGARRRRRRGHRERQGPRADPAAHPRPRRDDRGLRAARPRGRARGGPRAGGGRGRRRRRRARCAC